MRIVRPKEAQARLGIGHTKFYDAIKKGELPPLVRFGRVTGMPEDELNAVIDALKAARPARIGSEQQPAE